VLDRLGLYGAVVESIQSPSFMIRGVYGGAVEMHWQQVHLGDFQWSQVFSALALFVSLSTAYFSLFRRGKLKTRLGETLLLQLNSDGRLRVFPELAMHNPGASLGMVYHLTGELRRQAEDSREQLRWRSNLTTVFVDDGRRADTRFESLPGVIFLPKGDGLAKRLNLHTEHSYPLFAGDIDLTIDTWSGGFARKTTKVAAQIKLSQEDVDFLKEHQLPSPDSSGPFVHLFLRRGQGVDCFIRA
jgi:hypothetical protein